MGRDALNRLWVSIAALGARRLLALAVVGIGIMTVLGIGAAYLGRPQQEVLYSGLTRDDVGRVGAALREAGIDFDVSQDGTTVNVNYGETARARMLLAEKGLPQSSDSGYEIFNKVGSFGLTSFMQDVTKTRALEGELARSIQSMNGIKAARVHLVLPDRGSFRNVQQAASASVVISTEMPTDTAPAQAIRHLVAAAVPGLKIDNVTVLNTEGVVLASSDDAESASAGKMAMVEQTINQDIEAKVRRTLAPYLGLGNFQVSVVSRVNIDRSTTSETIFDPSSRVERSVRTVRENALAQNTTTDKATSVEQNLPSAVKGGSDGGTGKNSNETNDRREELTNYEVSSRTIETAHDGFKIENLSIAVLVNKEQLAAAAGKGADALPVEHQMMEIEQLVSAAAGYSKPRGDQLKVAAVSFLNDGPVEIPAPGILSTVMAQFGSVLNSLALVVVALVTVLFGLRPAVNAILARSPGPVAAMPVPESGEAVAAVANESAPQIAAAAAAGVNVNLIEDVTKRMNRSPQKRLEQIVEYDEAQAAAILRQWLRQDEAA
jgi:flagellar M-ring protein FliF